MIALVSAGAVALAGGGYAIGAVSHRGTNKQSAVCDQAEQEFESRAGQLRKQVQMLQRGFGLDGNARDEALDEAQRRILAEVVQQNPTCFGAGMRAAAAVIQQSRSEREADAAICDLVGIKADGCAGRHLGQR
ncbi:hypothetical protein GCM10023176_34390 [Micromonospora coerulea]|uniref:Uncharacterized protein n=1 Tax=Micromonospora coerulea TaxID=47856 RepID=A0ABP8SP25_9ACTN